MVTPTDKYKVLTAWAELEAADFLAIIGHKICEPLGFKFGIQSLVHISFSLLVHGPGNFLPYY